MTGIEKFAYAMQLEMQRGVKGNLILDFGTINDDYSLKTNTFGIPIPATDYLICRGISKAVSASITIDSATAGTHAHSYSTTSGTTSAGGDLHSHSVSGTTESAGGHIHSLTIPDAETKLKPGDRVLVAWVGADAVIIDVILPATEVII
jgi:hypothetical protein